jgi:hypothetical protein
VDPVSREKRRKITEDAILEKVPDELKDYGRRILRLLELRSTQRVGEVYVEKSKGRVSAAGVKHDEMVRLKR